MSWLQVFEVFLCQDPKLESTVGVTMAGLGSFKFEESAKRKRMDEPVGGTPGSANGGGGDGGKATGGSIGKRQADNLDFRLRVQESITMETFKVSTAALSHPLYQNIKLAKDAFSAERPATKGQQHPWGSERNTLALGLLQALHTAKGVGMKAWMMSRAVQIREADELAQILGQPTVEAQMQAVAAWSLKIPEGAPGRAKMSEWLEHFQFTATKKKDGYLLRITVGKGTVLQHTHPFLRILFLSTGAELLEGTAPARPLYHKANK